MSPENSLQFISKRSPLSSLTLDPPVVDIQSSHNAFMVELLIIYNPYPKKNHWAFFVQSHMDPDIGAVIHATGSTKSGFKFEVKRYYDFKQGNGEGKRIPLQLIDGANINEKAMLNNKKYKLDSIPVCKFEMSVCKVAPPKKDQHIVNSSVSFYFLLCIILLDNYISLVSNRGLI
jgi:hypothetical protein